MSAYKKHKGKGIVLHYGYDSNIDEFWYEVEDVGQNMIVESQGTRTTYAPPILIAEKLKQFDCPVQHIQAILDRKIF